MGKLYDEKSIESLDPREFTRLRPQVYCGDTSYSTQLLIEIFSNALDEFNLNHGNEIQVKVNTKTNECCVTDFGQGFIPNSFREDGKSILEAAFSVLNTSGKYREDGVYEGTSLGSFGIGSKITTFLSHWLVAETSRNGEQEKISFKEGVFEKREKGNDKNLPNGTKITWKPSEEFFASPAVEISKLQDLFNTIACLCPGITIKFQIDNKTETYFSKNGLEDYVNTHIKSKELSNRLVCHYKEGKNKFDLVMAFTDQYTSTIVPYVNTGLTEGGPHISQIKSTLTREMNKFFRDKKWLKDKDEGLSGEDIQEGLYMVFNITAPNVAYDNQVKARITKIDMAPFTRTFAEELNSWMAANEKDLKKIVDKALTARKAREAAKKARDAVRTPKEKKERLLNLPTKLIDCYSKNRGECELLIAEGDSAASGLVSARVGEYQAVFPIRGKIISSFKNTDSKIFANQEVVNIIKALGLDLDSQTKKLVYNKSKLRYGKIVLCADADPDGENIKNLLLTLFWWLCPELVTNGHIYAAVPPLFRRRMNISILEMLKLLKLTKLAIRMKNTSLLEIRVLVKWMLAS